MLSCGYCKRAAQEQQEWQLVGLVADATYIRISVSDQHIVFQHREPMNVKIIGFHRVSGHWAVLTRP